MSGMTSGFTATVAAEVRAEMARQRITQESLADSLGVAQQTISRRLTGEVAFDLAELERIAGILGVPLSRFLASAA